MLSFVSQRLAHCSGITTFDSDSDDPETAVHGASEVEAEGQLGGETLRDRVSGAEGWIGGDYQALFTVALVAFTGWSAIHVPLTDAHHAVEAVGQSLGHQALSTPAEPCSSAGHDF